jgi:hypothetical protein
MDPQGRGALWCSVDRQGLSVGTATAATVMLGWHSGMRATYIDCSLLVAGDIYPYHMGSSGYVAKIPE